MPDNANLTPESTALGFFDAINTKDFAKLERLLSPALVTEKGSSRDNVLSNLKMFSSGFDDLHFRTDNVFRDGPNVAIRWTMTGTHTAPFSVYKEATGNKIDHQGVALFRVENGAITEYWPGTDRSRVSAQINGTAPAVQSATNRVLQERFATPAALAK